MCRCEIYNIDVRRCSSLLLIVLFVCLFVFEGGAPYVHVLYVRTLYTVRWGIFTTQKFQHNYVCMYVRMCVESFYIVHWQSEYV